MTAALLVVDMQNDFCTPAGFFHSVVGLDISHGEAIVPRIHSLAATARRRNVPVIYTRSIRRDPARQTLMPERPFYMAGGSDDAADGNDESLRWGSEIADALRPEAGDVVIDKPRYSAFYNTRLADVLREMDIETVVLTGMTSNCCIDSTMRDAYFRDFNVVVVADCIAGFGGEEHLHDATLENARLVFGVVVTADELTGSDILMAGTASSPPAPERKPD